jgi:hypothetical protein
MSKDALQSVIGRAVTDKKFRYTLFANPDKALADYDLTEEEISSLKSIDAETMDDVAGTLDDRMSRVAWNVFDTAYSPADSSGLDSHMVDSSGTETEVVAIDSDVTALDSAPMDGSGAEIGGADLDMDAVIQAAAGMDRGGPESEAVELEVADADSSGEADESADSESDRV